MKGYWRLCAAARVSVALEPVELGYPEVHGHDLEVEACYCGAKGRADVEAIEKVLRDALGVERIHLDKFTGKRGSLIEDLIVEVYRKLPSTLGGLEICSLEARWLWGARKIRLDIQQA